MNRKRTARRGATVVIGAAVVALALVWASRPESTAERGPVAGSESPPGSPRLRVVSSRPHGDRLFTQGLVFSGDGRLFESGGRYGASEVAELDPDTGRVVARAELPAEVFAEGLAAGPDGLVQLTWKEGRAFRWTLGLDSGGEWIYGGEGWGLAYDPERNRFLRSDGSATITFHDSVTFAATGRVSVTRDGAPVAQLNELELIGDVLYANVWKSAEILRIDPDTGAVTATIDASIIDPDLEDPESVLNGIAHRPGDPPNRLWLTGKNWPQLFEVDLVAR